MVGAGGGGNLSLLLILPSPRLSEHPQERGNGGDRRCDICPRTTAPLWGPPPESSLSVGEGCTGQRGSAYR